MQGSLPPGSLDAASSAALARGDIRLGTAGPNKSRYRGVSYDKKKRKWRVQIKVRQEEQKRESQRTQSSRSRVPYHTGGIHYTPGTKPK